MNNSLLTSVDLIYRQSAGVHQVFLAAEHQPFRELCRLIFSLDKEIKGDDNEDIAAEFLGPAKQYMWAHLQTPLPFNSSDSLNLIRRYKAINQNGASILPNYVTKLDEISVCLTDLSETSTNPMSEAFVKLLEDIEPGLEVGLVVSRSRMVDTLEDLLDHLNRTYGVQKDRFVSLSPDQLKEQRFFDCLVLFGQEWIIREAEYVLTAPRSKGIYRIGYPWIRFKQSIASGFISSQLAEGEWPYTNVGNVGGLGFGAETGNETLSVPDLNEIQEPINLVRIAARYKAAPGFSWIIT